MDLPKFASLLFTGSLFFARASIFDDPFEGSLPQINVLSRNYILEARHRDEQLESFRSLSDDQLKGMFEMQETFNREQREKNFVSCWHKNDYESAAMWQLYARAGDSIAIQTTFDRLAEALPSYIHMGEVTYIDYESDVIEGGNLFDPLLRKRQSYAHEQEVRAIAWELLSANLGGDTIRANMTGTGLPITVSLNEVIEAVYVSPTSAPWFTDVVRKLIECQGFSFSVHKSSLNAKPLF